MFIWRLLYCAVIFYIELSTDAGNRIIKNEENPR